MNEEERLVDFILHRLRNTELLSLAASIHMASMEGRAVLDIEKSYYEFAYSLESRIKESINDFNKTN